MEKLTIIPLEIPKGLEEAEKLRAYLRENGYSSWVYRQWGPYETSYDFDFGSRKNGFSRVDFTIIGSINVFPEKIDVELGETSLPKLEKILGEFSSQTGKNIVITLTDYYPKKSILWLRGD